MKNIDICYGLYASKYGLTDFYEESEQKLKAAIASGEDFDTGWWGCAKEIRYARICRDHDGILVEVACHMDDLWDGDDLIYDALSDECGVEEELPDDIIDSIRDAAIDDGIDDQTELDYTLPADATFEEVARRIELLESYAEIDNKSMYSRLCGIVGAHWEYMHGTASGNDGQD